MKFASFLCLFSFLFSIFVLAEPGNASRIVRSNARSATQAPRRGTPSNLGDMPHAAFAQRGMRMSPPVAPELPGPELNFAPAVTYDSGGVRAFSVAIADVNGDGKKDIVVANCGITYCDSSDGGVGVLLGNGDGTFQSVTTYDSGGYGTLSVAVADVNGDGKPDLVVSNTYACSNCSNGSVGVLLGNGDGTFQKAVTYDSGGFWTTFVTVADVNGDGKPDIEVSSGCSSASKCGDGVVGVLLGNGDGTFQPAVAYDSGGVAPYALAVADVNRDGKPDLLVPTCGYSTCGSAAGKVSVLLGKGDGTFHKAVTYSSGGYGAYSIAVADVNGDSKPDLLVTNWCASSSNCGDGEVAVLLGNGDGTFQKAVTYDSGGSDPYSLAIADVDGDGTPDAVVANVCAPNCDYGPVVSVLLGNGDGTFQKAVSYNPGGIGAQGVAVADVNHDGRPDLVVANDSKTDSGGDGVVGVLLNTTVSATATALTSSPNPSQFHQLVTFTATVKSLDFPGVPTGTVTFYKGSTEMGASTLDKKAVAAFKTSDLSVGTHSITAKYSGDTNFEPSTSPVLHQVVQGAIVALSPRSLVFGAQDVGSTSPAEFVRLKNTGNIDLTISSIQIIGQDGSDFAQINNCPSSLSPKDTCTIQVTFTPTTTGLRQATVAITDNAPHSPQELPLAGRGVVPAVAFSPKSLTFPTQLIFTTSEPRTVTLTNTGAGVLIITRIGTTGPFSQTNNCPASLKSLHRCTIRVKFHPKNKGELKGSIDVTDNATGSPQQVPLTGTGTYVQLQPRRLDFGIQPVHTKSLSKRIALTNQGHETLHITSITITGTDAGDFSETNNCGQVRSGASCFIKVWFEPLKKGKRRADVSTYDDGGGSPQDVSLSGTGT
jgi:hypothetical protein